MFQVPLLSVAWELNIYRCTQVFGNLLLFCIIQWSKWHLSYQHWGETTIFKTCPSPPSFVICWLTPALCRQGSPLSVLNKSVLPYYFAHQALLPFLVVWRWLTIWSAKMKAGRAPEKVFLGRNCLFALFPHRKSDLLFHRWILCMS